MKKILFLTILSLAFVACKNEVKISDNEVNESEQEIAYASYGMEINDADALTAERMIEHYKGMEVGDTINAKMKGKIMEVCSKKGCWMKLDMGTDETVRVTFKDYGFFMPLDSDGEVVINGKAFVSETSVEDLKHYAEDAGKSEEEIAAINTPEKTYGFVADGVLLKE
ncbi:DUF4920 domain-containing protein [Winogradskyella ursingii]|uniref:DUF4920 domain-containing protein n=1 Tax=Winogradskyella ursingii TaxID=2686079 RepID=UPI0015CE5599|nr:DUF4920 domain-containing protein [Winogradskyella ursingii]